MTSTFILDSAFLTDLSEFDGHCHTVPFRPAKTPDELPFAGLEHVARADANLVLLNDALTHLRGGNTTEVFYEDEGKLACSPWLLTQLSRTPQLYQYFQQKAEAGELRHFASAADYNDALGKGLKHCLCVIDTPREQGRHVLAPERTSHNMRRKESIRPVDELLHAQQVAVVSLIEQLSATPEQPALVLTPDAQMAQKAEAHGAAALSAGDYYAMLHLCGFIDNPRTFAMAENQRAQKEGREPTFTPASPERVAELTRLVHKTRLDVSEAQLSA